MPVGMKTLIVEDDFTCSLLLQEILKIYGQIDTAASGDQGFEAVKAAYEAGAPYDLVCLDIMMEDMNGQQALREIRCYEEARGIAPKAGVKVIMTTSLSDMKNIMFAYHSLCDGYLVKPIAKAKLLEELKKLNLLGSA
jgi:two-component system chemotaxis response regulator CheY